MNALLSFENVLARLDSRNQSDDERLIVTWQHPESRKISPVGMLSKLKSQYTFHYIANALTTEDFRPLLGFSEFDRAYVAEELFPLFAQRAMDPKRPDFIRYVHSIGLQDDPTPWEQITASGGKRAGDTLQLFPVPRRIAPNTWQCSFLAHGMQYVFREDLRVGDNLVSISRDELEEALNRLTRGTELLLQRNPDNPKNSNARLLTTTSNIPLGYLPDLLVQDIRQLADDDIACSVHTINQTGAPWHMRLVATLTCTTPEDFKFFSSPSWELLGD